MPLRFFWAVLAIVILAAPASIHDPAEKDYVRGLSQNKLISSSVLGYDLQYRVFVPENTPENAYLPVLYVTDGQWYIGQGDLPGLMNTMIDRGEISPAIAVFVDNRDPHNLSNNRRSSQFFCNDKYVQFFRDELVPAIEAEFDVASTREDRVMLGLSFGGLNSACFGLMAGDTFRGIAMQSPAMHPVRTIHRAYQDSLNLDLKIFLSSGSERDNEDAARRLRDILEDKKYEMSYIEVPFGHSWDNWKPLLDDVLTFYYGNTEAG